MNALFGVVTKAIENPQAFVPKSPGGLCSEGVTELVAECSASEYITDAQLIIVVVGLMTWKV